AMTVTVALPEGASLDLLDAYGYESQTGRWRFLPSQPTAGESLVINVGALPQRIALFNAGPVDPAVIVPVNITQDSSDEAGQLATIVAPAGLTPNAAGQLIGSLAPGWQPNA